MLWSQQLRLLLSLLMFAVAAAVAAAIVFKSKRSEIGLVQIVRAVRPNYICRT